MRLNKFLAHASGISRRDADTAIESGRVIVNGAAAHLGMQVNQDDIVTLDDKALEIGAYQYLLMNKPIGYVSSRKGQSAPTLYELLPDEFIKLKTVGRLDKDSSGILLLTDDGDYANTLTHPSFKKEKKYRVKLDKFLTDKGMSHINRGVQLEDGVSSLKVDVLGDGFYEISMSEGRNRQIRRTFQAIGYEVIELHRFQFGPYNETDLKDAQYASVKKIKIVD